MSGPHVGKRRAIRRRMSDVTGIPFQSLGWIGGILYDIRAKPPVPIKQAQQVPKPGQPVIGLRGVPENSRERSQWA